MPKTCDEIVTAGKTAFGELGSLASPSVHNVSSLD